MILPILLCALALFFTVAQLTTLVIAWRRCRSRSPRRLPLHRLPPVTVVRPLCGIEAFTAETLNAAFTLDYPAFELLFCVADPNDPIVPRVEAAIAAHPGIEARLLIGNDEISINPKLNNMVKGWRAARYEWIVFIDSNVRVGRGFLRRCMATWRPDTGAVSAPPVGLMPQNFGGWLECAFLNTYEARWQYAVDSVGNGFAQGKTLFYRKADLDRSELRDLACEPAEDAATTKMVRAMGLKVRLAPPSPMPIGCRDMREVWGRQLRWARLRRVTFPLEFLPEIFSGAAVPVLVFAAFVGSLGGPALLAAIGYLALWEGSEVALAAACRWPAGWRLALALVMRDVLLPALWVAALSGSSITWKGTAMTVERRRPVRRFAMRDIKDLLRNRFPV